MNLRILIISGLNVDAGYGGEIWIKEVATRLAMSNDVVVLTTVNGPRNTNFAEIMRNSAIEIIEIDLKNAVKSFLTVSKYFRGADIVYYLSYGIPFKAALVFAQQMFRIPVVNGHHSDPFDKIDVYHKNEKVSDKIMRIFNDLVDKYFKAHHVENEEDKVKLENKAFFNVYKIPLGIDIEFYKPMEKYSKFTITWIGRLDETKGADLLPQIIDLLFSNHDITEEIDFVIAGDGVLRDIIRALSNKFASVKYLGFISDGKKQELMAKSHVLISTSRAETFPQTGLQAIACGTPVIYFDIRGPREFIIPGKNGYLASDVLEFTQHIKTIFENWQKGSYDSFSIESRKISEKFNVNEMVTKIGKMIESIIQMSFKNT